MRIVDPVSSKMCEFQAIRLLIFKNTQSLTRAWPGSQPNAIDRGGGRITPPQANSQTNDRS